MTRQLTIRVTSHITSVYMVAVPDDFDARNDALLELAEDNHDDLLLLSQQPSADAELVNDEQMP